MAKSNKLQVGSFSMNELSMEIVYQTVGALLHGHRPKSVMILGSPGIGKTMTIESMGPKIMQLLQEYKAVAGPKKGEYLVDPKKSLDELDKCIVQVFAGGTLEPV